jgi:probable phosphoglycerate mutase
LKVYRNPNTVKVVFPDGKKSCFQRIIFVFSRTMTNDNDAKPTSDAPPFLNELNKNSSAPPPNRLWNVSSLHNSYYALRHGQSEANVAGVIASDPTVATVRYGLSPLGKQQAQRAGEAIVKEIQTRQYSRVVIVSSDLLRAKETAEIVHQEIQNHNKDANNTLELSFRFDERLRERSFGIYDGTSDDHYHVVWQHDAQSSSTSVHASVEPVDTVTRRVTELILALEQSVSNTDDALTPNNNKNNKTMIISVAHGDVLQILQTAFLKRPGSSHRSIKHLETATLRALELAATESAGL